MRLAIFLYGLTGGGATRRTLTLAEAFAQRGHEVSLVVVSPEGALSAEISAIAPSVSLIGLESKAVRLIGALGWGTRRKQLIAVTAALAGYLRRERPELLMSAANHAHLTALWARSLARVAVPLVLRVSNHLTDSHLSTAGRPRPVRLRVARRWYGRADAVIAVSKGIAEDLARHTSLPQQRIFTIYNPTFVPDLLEKAAEPLDHPWVRAGEVPLILGAGRLAAQKDFPTLIRAFDRVCRQRPARLVVLGEGGQRPKLTALAERLGIAERVSLPGFVDNPFAWMSRASVFVLSSAWEGFPGVLIEAMACGCPVVSTDCPSGPAEILEGGALGRLVPVGDDDLLARAILDTLGDPADPAPLVEQAQRFSVDGAVDGYLRVFETVLGNRGPVAG